MPNIDDYIARETAKATPATTKRRVWMDEAIPQITPMNKSEAVQTAPLATIESKSNPTPSVKSKPTWDQNIKDISWNRVMTITVPTIAGAALLPIMATGLALSTPVIGGCLGAIAGASYILGREQQEK
ncbi:MAG: hypothetical protein HN353_01565 [Bdellovibrionales bacterium]|jgi:hypothetical protein|nr:hypothetical protein [Bdellovibrionales bacterium]MBT3525432.1 hypothetical protein [Bdellovibrionales bacterium]MBT7767935.1 hypothetical protein [Bdellovibrionales bacterium]